MGSSVFDQLEAAPVASTKTTSKVRVPAFSFKIVFSDFITTFGVISLLVNLIVNASVDLSVAPEAEGVTIIDSVDSYALSSIPVISKLAESDPGAILITGFNNSFLNLYSSLSYAKRVPPNSAKDVTCLNCDWSAVPST